MQKANEEKSTTRKLHVAPGYLLIVNCLWLFILPIIVVVATTRGSYTELRNTMYFSLTPSF